MFSHTLRADATELPRVHEAVHRFWAQTAAAGVRSDAVERAAFHTAVIEVSTNVIRHAYPQDPEGLWTLTLVFDGGETVEALVEDAGRPFLGHASRPLARFAAGSRDLPEGGYGMALARASVDEMEYVRLPGPRNRWRLSKRLHADPRPPS